MKLILAAVIGSLLLLSLPCPLWPHPRMTPLETNTDRPGNDYDCFAPPFATPEICAAACAIEAPCASFTFVKPDANNPNGRCCLKNVKSAPQGDSRCVSGEKEGYLAMPVSFNTNLPGADYRDFELSSPDPSLCIAECALDAQCKAYTYVVPGVQGPRAHCWLKSKAPDPATDLSCLSGVKYSSPSYSLRIGTFNAGLLQKPVTGPDDDQLQARAHRIAARVNESGYDVIAFNELFSDGVADTLLRQLVFYGRFPYFALDLDRDIIGHNSGLGLFSKYPLVDLPPRLWDSGIKNDYFLWSPGGDVGFFEFHDCESWDCWASKGAALVRIVHPLSFIPYHVVFTHLNDNIGSGDVSFLAGALDPAKLEELALSADLKLHLSQVMDVTALIRHYFDPGRGDLDHVNVFIFGDHNIDGSPTDEQFKNREVWKRVFEDSTLGTYKSLGFRDVWLNEAAPGFDYGGLNPNPDKKSPNDPGATKPNGRRIDYFIRNATKTPERMGLCVQHFTRGYHLQADGPYLKGGPEWDGALAGTTPLSDHHALAVDINRGASHCSPVSPSGLKDKGLPADWGAREILFDPSAPGPLKDPELEGVITYPGSMQWYYVNEKGTFSIGFVGTSIPEGLEFRVYTRKDLSVPVVWYREETYSNDLTQPVRVSDRITIYPFTGQKYVIPEPPFYIRVFHHDRTWTGRYRLHLHKHDCSSQKEACILKPYREQEFDGFPLDKLLNPEDSSWWQVDVEQLSNKAEKQILRFIASAEDGNVDHIKVRDENGTLLFIQAQKDPKMPLPPWGGTCKTPTGHKCPEVYYMQKEFGGPPQKLYVTVKRKDLKYTKFTVGWATDLTVIFSAPNDPINLVCDKQQELGEDEIHMAMEWDGTGDTGFTRVGDMDDEEQDRVALQGTFPGRFPLRFRRECIMTLMEADGFLRGDNDYSRQLILPMALGGKDEHGIPSWKGLGDSYPQETAFDLLPGDDGGKYHMRYMISHGLQEYK